MKAVFNDMQDYSSTLDGATVESRCELFTILDSARDREPFVCELAGENGYRLLMGISKDVGCVQHSSTDGDPPYLMALAPGEHREGEGFEFLVGNTPTPIAARNTLAFQTMKEIAAHFIETGERSSDVSWEEV